LDASGGVGKRSKKKKNKEREERQKPVQRESNNAARKSPWSPISKKKRAGDFPGKVLKFTELGKLIFTKKERGVYEGKDREKSDRRIQDEKFECWTCSRDTGERRGSEESGKPRGVARGEGCQETREELVLERKIERSERT